MKKTALIALLALAWPGIAHAGTVNRVSKFTAPTIIGDSQVTDNGTNVGVSTGVPQAKLDVNGSVLLRSTVTFPSGIIQSAGNVGIGTTIPTGGYLLDVLGAARFNNGDLQIISGNINANVPLVAATGTFNAQLSVFNAGNATSFNVDAATFSVLKAGNVGVGTSAPTSKMHVVDGDIKITTTTGSRGLIFQDGTSMTTASGGSQWTTTGSNIYYNTGNVGIGTTNPSSGALQVYVNGIEELRVSSGTNGNQVLIAQNNNTSRPDIGGWFDPDTGWKFYSGQMDGMLNGNVTFEFIPTQFRLNMLGTAEALPSISMSNDVDSGINWPSANVVTINTAGAKRIQLDSTGASVTGNMTVSTVAFIADGTAGAPSLAFTNDPDTGIRRNTTNSGILEAGGAITTIWDTARLKVNLAGSGSAPSFTIFDNNTGLSNVSSALVLTTNATERMRVHNGGNIGIGNTAPTSKVHVSSGVIYQDGTTPYHTFVSVTSTPTAAATQSSLWALTVGSSSELKVIDGGGNIRNVASPVTSNYSGPALSTAGAAAAFELASATIPANALNVDGKTIAIKSYWSLSAATAIGAIYINGSSVAAYTSVSGGSTQVFLNITRTSSGNQAYFSLVDEVVGGGAARTIANGTLTLTDTNAIVVSFRGTSPGATTATLRAYEISYP